MSYLYNKSKEKEEKCVQVTCPRCKGFGSTSDDDGEKCHLCKGYGTVWESVEKSGWYRALYDRIDNSQLY